MTTSTCIVGKAYPGAGTVIIGADSAGVSKGHDITPRKDPKVFTRCGGNIIIGCTSSFRMISILHYRLKIGPPPSSAYLDQWMNTTFIDAVREAFDDGGYMKKDDSKEVGGRFLVGVRDRLFRVDTDFQVGESARGYEAVGCGGSYAAGALAVGSHLDTSLKVAEEHSGGVQGPFFYARTGVDRVYSDFEELRYVLDAETARINIGGLPEGAAREKSNSVDRPFSRA